MVDVVGNILGHKDKSKNLFGIGKAKNTDDDWNNPEHLTPQVCTKCGEKIKQKDIYYFKGNYKHKSCAMEESKEKRERRRK